MFNFSSLLRGLALRVPFDLGITLSTTSFIDLFLVLWITEIYLFIRRSFFWMLFLCYAWLFCFCSLPFPCFVFISSKLSQDNVPSMRSQWCAVLHSFSPHHFLLLHMELVAIPSTTAPTILQLVCYSNSTLGYRIELTCYFNLVEEFPVTFRMTDLHIAAVQSHCNIWVVIFACSMFSVSFIRGLQPGGVLRSVRHLGAGERLG